MRVLLLVLLLLPQLASARVYMCVDNDTGKTSFSDRGCQTTAAVEEVKVGATNAFSGNRAATSEAIVPKETWVSDRDTRKTGRDYAKAQRALDESKDTGTASDRLMVAREES